MNIIEKPSSLSLLGNLKRFVIASNYELTFTLKTDAGTLVMQHSYTPNKAKRVEIDLKAVLKPLLSCSLLNQSEPYRQPYVARTFQAVVAEVVAGVASGSQTLTFKVLKAGVDEMSDSTENFLQQNFLTWQPSIKPVTYHSPEFLTYYAVAEATVKCRAAMPDGTGMSLTLATIPAGECWTVPLQYAVVASKCSKLPAYYDVWVENASGARLTYIQRYYADGMRSEQEDWVLFENSLGGIDTFRAYGDSENKAEHTHNVVEMDEQCVEYRVDTSRLHTKNTGYLDERERRWLLDFFPSTAKYIYTDSHIRPIVVTESDAAYKQGEAPSSYTFTYRYATTQPYLNLPRIDTPLDVMELKVPDVGSFTIAPRLVEFPRLALSRGAIYPIQDPYSEGWGTTTLGAMFDWIVGNISSSYSGDGGVGHTHVNLTLLDAFAMAGEYLTVNGQKLKAALADEAVTLQDNKAVQVITFMQGLVANGLVTAKAGVQYGPDFIPGLLGQGGMIDGSGNGELDSLTLRKWLIVPEIRYNRITVDIGLRITSKGGGTIEKATPDIDQYERTLPLGSAWLKLEDGEYGAIALGDLCMGLWHDFRGGNATGDTDDKKGNLTMRGFKTVYFRITDIPTKDPDGLDNSDQHYFRYALRSIDDGGNDCHPCSQMHFAQRGNTDNSERQAIVFSTVDYDLNLKNVNTWEFQDSQLYYIARELEGFAMEQIGADGKTYTKHFHGHGLVFGDAYIYGHVDEFERAGYRLEITRSNDGRITSSSPDKVTVRVLNGYGADVSSKFSTYKLARDSGDPEADAEWNKQHESVGNEFTIAALALGTMAYIQPILFTITASGEDVSDVSASFTERLVSTEELHIEFQPIEGKSYVVNASNVDTIVEARLYFGQQDITDDVLLRSSSRMKWTRDSGIPTEDAAWTATTGETANVIHIIDRINDRHDCGSRWSEKLKVLFTFECGVVFGVESMTLSATMSIGN